MSKRSRQIELSESELINREDVRLRDGLTVVLVGADSDFEIYAAGEAEACQKAATKLGSESGTVRIGEYDSHGGFFRLMPL